MSFWNHKKVIAKKKHRCCWCYQIIEIGEKYLYETGVSEDTDGFQSNHYHFECRAAADETWKEDGYCELGDRNERPFVDMGINI